MATELLHTGRGRDRAAATGHPAQLTAAAARRIVSEINAHARDTRRLVKELHDGRGWLALGYETWEACVAAEFDFSRFHSHLLIRAAEVDEDVSPIGDAPVRVSHAKLLARAPRELRAEVYARAREKAGAGPVSARLVREVLVERGIIGAQGGAGRGRGGGAEALSPSSPGAGRDERLEREYAETEDRMPVLALAYLYKRFKKFIPFDQRREVIDRLRWATREDLAREFAALART